MRAAAPCPEIVTPTPDDTADTGRCGCAHSFNSSKSADTMLQENRTEALAAAKAATRAYARDPSDANAARVEAAWQAVRRLETVTVRRRLRQAEHADRPIPPRD